MCHLSCINTLERLFILFTLCAINNYVQYNPNEPQLLKLPIPSSILEGGSGGTPAHTESISLGGISLASPVFEMVHMKEVDFTNLSFFKFRVRLLLSLCQK